MDKKISSFFKSEIFFLVPYAIWVFFSIFRTNFYFLRVEPYYVLLSIICMAFLILHEFFYLKDYTWKDILGALITFFLFVVAFLLKEGTVMYSVLCVFISRHTSMKKLILATFISVTSMFVIIVGSSQVGIIPDYIAEDFGRNRHYLGFLYALTPSVIFTNISAMYIYLRNKKIFFIECIGLLAIAFLLYLLTDSRLAFITSVVIILGGYVLKWIVKINQKPILLSIIFVLCVISAPICTAITTYYSSIQHPLLVKVDERIGYRFQKGYEAYHIYGLSLGINDIEFFGNGLDFHGQKQEANEDNYVDSFYLQYSLRYGLLFMGIVLMLYLGASIHMAVHYDIFALFFFAIFALNGIITDQIFTLFFNGFLLYLGRVFKDKESYNL